MEIERRNDSERKEEMWGRTDGRREGQNRNRDEPTTLHPISGRGNWEVSFDNMNDYMIIDFQNTG